jgi:hypothetical protein
LAGEQASVMELENLPPHLVTHNPAPAAQVEARRAQRAQRLPHVHQDRGGAGWRGGVAPGRAHAAGGAGGAGGGELLSRPLASWPRWPAHLLVCWSAAPCLPGICSQTAASTIWPHLCPSFLPVPAESQPHAGQAPVGRAAAQAQEGGAGGERRRGGRGRGWRRRGGGRGGGARGTRRDDVIAGACQLSAERQDNTMQGAAPARGQQQARAVPGGLHTNNRPSCPAALLSPG